MSGYKVLNTTFLTFLVIICNAQVDEPYEWSKSRDLPLLFGGAGLFAGSHLVFSNQNPLTISEIAALDRTNVSRFDRSALDNYSKKSGTISDVLRTTIWSFPLAVIFSNKRIRRDFKIVGLMAVETYLINAGITDITKIAARRVRPFVYNTEVPLEEKTGKGVRRSFFSGHTSATASFAFLLAKIVNDYSDNKTVKTLVWGSAFVLPGIVRVSTGQSW